jgi:nitrogen fixation/metabolism regulation signal transduction histidine kinase
MQTKNAQFQRKRYFIDRKLQGRYMLTFFIPMIVMLGFMLFTLYFGTRTIIDSTTRILQRDVENSIALQLQDQPNPSAAKYKSVIDDLSGSIKSFSESRELKHEMLGTLLWVFGVGLFLVIIQIVLLTIFFSHKVAGPIYRLECECREVIEGRYVSEIRIRKGDDLQNLAALFNTAVSVSRQRLVDLINAETEEKRKEIASKLQL